VVKLHHPKTWNKNLIKLVRSGRSSDNIFSSVLRLVISFFHSPTLMIWSCFFFSYSFSQQFIISHSQHFVGSNRIFILLMFQSWKLFFMRQHSRTSIFILLFSPTTKSFTDTHLSSSFQGSERFLLRECLIHASALALRTKKIGCLGKKALETRDIKRNALVLVSAIYFPHWISVSLYLCWFH